MTSQKTLKMVTFTGPAVIENNRVTLVKFTRCDFADGSAVTLSAPNPPNVALSAKTITEALYPAGTRVVILDGSKVSAKLGSSVSRDWNGTKQAAMGKVLKVDRVDDDGDISISDMYFSPDFVRKATSDDEKDGGALKVDDLVVCEKPHPAEGAPNWLESMNDICGKVGKVIELATFVRVGFGEKGVYSFLPSWLRRVSPAEAAARSVLNSALASFPVNEGASVDAVAELVKSTLGKRARQN